jgi:hypothetical protein
MNGVNERKQALCLWLCAMAPSSQWHGRHKDLYSRAQSEHPGLFIDSPCWQAPGSRRSCKPNLLGHLREGFTIASWRQAKRSQHRSQRFTLPSDLFVARPAINEQAKSKRAFAVVFSAAQTRMVSAWARMLALRCPQWTSAGRRDTLQGAPRAALGASWCLAGRSWRPLGRPPGGNQGVWSFPGGASCSHNAQRSLPGAPVNR